jgi:YgiT-type zinc finger domain-containing protein
MENMTCEICEAQATAVKFEAEEMINEDNERTSLNKVKILICQACAEDYYDGTEEFPGTYPLAG